MLKKIILFLVSGLFTLTVNYNIIAQNLLKNGNFNLTDPKVAGIEGVDGTAYWYFGLIEGGDGVLTNENGVIRVGNVKNPGNYNWSIQVIQAPVVITKGTSYRVSFDAKAAKDRRIDVKVGGTESRNWADYTNGRGGGRIIRITTKMKNYSFTFKMTEETDKNGSFEFQLGKDTNDVWLDNIKLEVIPESEHITPGVLRNGDFNNALHYWDVNDAVKSEIKNDELVMELSNSNDSSKRTYLKQIGLLFEQGKKYTLSFNARSDEKCDIMVNLGRVHESMEWETDYITPQTFQADNKNQSYSYTFIMREPVVYDYLGKLLFKFNNTSDARTGNRVYIDKVTIFEHEDAPINIIPVSQYDVVKNGHFDSSAEQWEASENVVLTQKDFKLTARLSKNELSSADYTIFQDGIELLKNENYHVSFTCSSNSGGQIRVLLANEDGTAAYSNSKTGIFDITGEEKVYNFIFTMRNQSDKNARLLFDVSRVGKQDASTAVVLDNIKVKKIFDYMDYRKSVKTRVNQLLARMTLEEKLGQLVMAERIAVQYGDIKTYGVGSILSGGGSAPNNNSPEGWIDMYNSFQAQACSTRLEIPIMYGVDAVHGHTNVQGATAFPHNIGLGATRNPELIEKVSAVIAQETALTGIDWSFGPCVAVVRDERWGRSYESFGETPELQRMLAAAYVRGMQGEADSADFTQGEHVIGSAKHFIGDGNTKWLTGEDDYTIDRGDVSGLSLKELKQIHAPGYIEAIDAGISTIMVSFNSIDGIHMHQHKKLLTGYLKAPAFRGGLGFKGFVVGDWNGISLISEVEPDYKARIAAAFNAGLDMAMEPEQWMDVYHLLKQAVEEKLIPISRIDDAVRRILTVKMTAGLFENPYTVKAELDTFGSPENREVAAQAVRESLVLLKNENDLLPLKKNAKIFVTGPLADNVGLQCGGWTIDWQGGSDEDGRRYIEGTSILDGIRSMVHSNGGQVVTGVSEAQDADLAIVVVGETPYAEGRGDAAVGGLFDLADVESKAAPGNMAALEAAQSLGVPVLVILVSGRPKIVTDHIADWDAFIAAWLPGTEGAAIADVLFGDVNFKGRLPITWPVSVDQLPINVDDEGYGRGDKKPLFEYGFGLEMNLQ